MNNKDWVGNSNSIYKTLGASNHCEEDREENDYYATDPLALETLLKFETFSHKIWEPACGGGHLANVLKNHGHVVRCSDIIDRGYENTKIIDFLQCNDKWPYDIITNPPYSKVIPFIYKSMKLLDDGQKLAMFLKVQFLEGGKRGILFEKYNPKTVYVFSERIGCGKNGVFNGSGAVAYAWYVWEKGYADDTIIKWIWKDESKKDKFRNDLQTELKKYEMD